MHGEYNRIQANVYHNKSIKVPVLSNFDTDDSYDVFTGYEAPYWLDIVAHVC